MREKIINKSAELFLNLGFKSVTMDDIAQEMGISKKTIYVHFSNKTKLVEAVTFGLFDTICNGIDHICEHAPNPIEELYSIKMFVMQHLKKLKCKQFEKMHSSVQESLQHGVDTGVFRDSIDVGFISRMYFTGMTGIKDNLFFPPEDYTMEYLMESYLEYHLRAIVTEKGFQVLNKIITSNQS